MNKNFFLGERNLRSKLERTRDYFILNACIKVLSKMESEIDLLRQENARLVAKNYELEAEIVKLSRLIEENARRDVRVKELEQKNTELEARLASLEQASLIVDRQPQNDNKMISEGLPEITDVHDVCRKQTQLEQCKPDSKTNNTVPEVSVS